MIIDIDYYEDLERRLALNPFEDQDALELYDLVWKVIEDTKKACKRDMDNKWEFEPEQQEYFEGIIDKAEITG